MAVVRINYRDELLRTWGAAFEALSDKEAKLVLVRAAKHEGQKALTQVRRALVRNSGLGKYGFSMNLVKLVPPNFDNIAVTITGEGNETNLAQFGARAYKRAFEFTTGKETKKKKPGGFVASPWAVRRQFPATFFVGDKVYHRLSAERGPIKQSYGPNIGREMQRDYVLLPWQMSLHDLNNAVAHELKRMMASKGLA